MRRSGGEARRISFRRRTSGSSGPSSARVLDLVLLRVEVLLAAGSRRGAAPGSRSPSRCRSSATGSPRAPGGPRRPAGRPSCRYSWRMSGVFTKKFGRKNSETGPASSVTYSLSSAARVLPGEVGVRLAEAGLRQRVHPRRAGEGLGQEDDVRVLLADVRMSHSQKPIGLVWGLSTRKMRTPRSTQNTHRPAQRLPQAAPVVAVEVDVVDVLVALGRVLRVLQRPVGAAVEPLRVLGQPGVVGRALDREVERDLEVVVRAPPRPGASKSASVPSSGFDRRVAALGAPPIAQGLPGSPRLGGGRVVAPLAVGACRSGGSAAGRPRRSRAPRAAGAASAPRRSRRTSAGRARTTRRRGPARGRRPPRRSPSAPARGAPGRASAPPTPPAPGPRRRARPPARRRAQGRADRLGHRAVGALQAPGRRPRAAPPPRRARSRGPPARRPACARPRRATTRTGPPRPRPGRRGGRGRLVVNVPRQRSGRELRHRLLGERRRAPGGRWRTTARSCS